MRWIRRRESSSVEEVAHAGEDHGEAEVIGGGDDFGIFHGAAWLNNGGGSGFGGFFDAVGEWEEGVRSHGTSLQRALRFGDSEFDGVHAAHLSGADSEGGAISGEHD